MKLLNRSTAPTIATAAAVNASHSEKPKPQNSRPLSKPKYGDLSAYAFSYNPPDFREFDRNFASLETAINACKQKRIAVTLLNMPLSQENRDLIPPVLDDRYKSSLTRLARENGIVVIQPETLTKFGSDHFEYSAPLRCQGSQKLFLSLGGVIAEMIRKAPASSAAH